MKVILVACIMSMVVGTIGLGTEMNFFFAGMIPEAGCCEGEDGGNGGLPGGVGGSTYDKVMESGELVCGYDVSYLSYATAMCNAVAGAMGVNPTLVQSGGLDRLAAVQDGSIHVNWASVTPTFTRTTTYGVQYSESHLFFESIDLITLTPQDSVSLVCVEADTTTAALISSFYSVLPLADADAAKAAFLAGDCDALGAPNQALYASENGFVFHGEPLDFDPISAVLPVGDLKFSGIVNGVINGLILAWKHGMTADNVDTTFDPTQTLSPSESWKLLGRDPADPENSQWLTPRELGLANDFVAQAVRLVGNYADVISLVVGSPSGINQLTGVAGGQIHSGARLQ